MAMEGAAVERILKGIGEAGYRWSLDTDVIEWSEGALLLLGVVQPAAIATGRAYAELSAPDQGVSRQDHVLTSVLADDGEGVPFQIEYAIRPQGPDGPLLWVEDTGRWFAGDGARPRRAEGVVRLVNERHAREARLSFLSRYDEETGLFNRSYLLDLLDESISQSKKLRTGSAFLVVAIDDLRLINEAFGIQAGDRALAAVAQRIRGRLREGDAVGRLTASKIGLVLNQCEEHEMAVAAERFLAAVRDDVISTSDSPMAVTVSIGGVAIPRHARDRAEAVERSQEALGMARAAGVGRFVAYAPSADRAARRQMNADLSRQLLGALGEGRLRLAFQPVVDASTRRPAFHEALLRLSRPDGSLTLAAQVVPLFGRLGLGRLFDAAVLDLVIAALERHPEPVLSVNVAPETASGPDWLAKLTAALSGRPELGRRLIVEITETSAIRNLEETSHFVGRIHELGARLAIDDFGAGFTSFRNLRALSVDIVKIDGSFIEHLTSRPDDRIFVRHMIQMAGELGISTVAEWVRDEESAALLTEWGVTWLQGDLSGEASLDPAFD